MEVQAGLLERQAAVVEDVADLAFKVLDHRLVLQAPPEVGPGGRGGAIGRHRLIHPSHRLHRLAEPEVDVGDVAPLGQQLAVERDGAS